MSLAYLHSLIEEDIYFGLPLEAEEFMMIKRPKAVTALKALKVLYGTKQGM
ncbi:hypothetical protein CROQUDRAFT_102547 [Cronartium quercuum f. sp. fusiforme G11]|uniref:Uncharacterized protein n=1 Tax=Cronartium quercuum f. sp. fusiforme G11 TaxID=708437 RepID=A0A9P6T614_9BASI|nr:hypothetical protein CROQUDRAFT_102547 [Cronartium quercuum f. sp. fusiforme G11]